VPINAAIFTKFWPNYSQPFFKSSNSCSVQSEPYLGKGLLRPGSIRDFSIGKSSLVSVLGSKTAFSILVCVTGSDFWGSVSESSDFLSATFEESFCFS